jgi:hypothetical protein
MRAGLFDRLSTLGRAVMFASALAACAGPSPQTAQQVGSTAAQDAAPARRVPDLRELQPRTGGPLPPQVASVPVKIDRSCGSDADCTIKDIGNCCGAAPACVNVDSPTDPKGVQAECARKGMASICGFKPIDRCQCVQGECKGVLMTTEAQ